MNKLPKQNDFQKCMKYLINKGYNRAELMQKGITEIYSLFNRELKEEKGGLKNA